MPATDTAQYSARVDEALVLAASAFRTHIRKGSGVPYLTHLLQVMATVGEFGGDEDQLIAAVLHDYLEDIEEASAEMLEAQFGARVRRIVEALSDSTVLPKPPWRARKERYLAHLRDAAPEVKLISAADKLHNARSILRDLETLGEALWERFTGRKEGTLWYYDEVVRALAEGWAHPLVEELRSVVARIHEASAPSSASSG